MTVTTGFSMPYEVTKKFNDYLEKKHLRKSEFIRELIEKEMAESEKEKAESAATTA